MSTTIIADYDTGNSFALKDESGVPLNLDSSALEIIGGVKTGLRTQIETDELFYADFVTKDLNRTREVGGDLVGVLEGGAVITSGQLDCTAATKSGVTYDLTNTMPVAYQNQVGTVRFEWTPNYNGAGVLTEHVYEEVGTGNNNRILITHMQSGTLQVSIYDSAGVLKASPSQLFTAVQGVKKEIEINFNSITGLCETYINGNLHFGVMVAPFTRSNTSPITTLKVGTTTAAPANNFFIDNIQRFETVKHTADFPEELPRSVPATQYSLTEHAISPIACATPFCFSTDDLLSFSSVIDEAGGSVGFISSVDSAKMYYDGASWVVSDGTLAQSNTAAEINTNAASLTSSGVSLEFLIVMKSTDGSATPSITSQSVAFSFFTIPVTPETCEMFGGVFHNGEPVEGARITFKSRGTFVVGDNHISIDTFAVSDANGYYDRELEKSANFDEPIDVVTSFIDQKGNKVEDSKVINVPDLDSAPTAGNLV